MSNGTRRLVLNSELGLIDDCFTTEETTPITASNQPFLVTLPMGDANASLANVLALRASGIAMSVEAPDPNQPLPGEPPISSGENGVPKFTFFIYDHLGNSRILYTNNLKDCRQDSTKYLLEHVLGYYPYGKTLREYVFVREKHQSTYHERDEETGLDYRGARFYDAEVGRFLSCDPFAADFAEWSTYNYVLGNPLSFMDLNGETPVPSEHYSFLTGRGLDIYLYARTKGASIFGSLVILSQAAKESGWGRGKITKANNYFGILWEGDGYSASSRLGTSAGPARVYPTFQAGLENYFTVLKRVWPEAIDCFNQTNFSATDLNGAFKIGQELGYTDSNQYGFGVLSTTNAVKRRIVGDLTIYIRELDKQINALGRRMISLPEDVKNNISGYCRYLYIQDYIQLQEDQEKAEERSNNAVQALGEIQSID